MRSEARASLAAYWICSRVSDSASQSLVRTDPLRSLSPSSSRDNAASPRPEQPSDVASGTRSNPPAQLSLAEAVAAHASSRRRSSCTLTPVFRMALSARRWRREGGGGLIFRSWKQAVLVPPRLELRESCNRAAGKCAPHSTSKPITGWDCSNSWSCQHAANVSASDELRTTKILPFCCCFRRLKAIIKARPPSAEAATKP